MKPSKIILMLTLALFASSCIRSRQLVCSNQSIYVIDSTNTIIFDQFEPVSDQLSQIYAHSAHPTIGQVALADSLIKHTYNIDKPYLVQSGAFVSDSGFTFVVVNYVYKTPNKVSNGCTWLSGAGDYFYENTAIFTVDIHNMTVRNDVY